MMIFGLKVQSFSDLGPLATFLGVIMAVVVASIQIAFNRRAQAEKQAFDTYQGFLKDCVEQPELASGLVTIPAGDWKEGDAAFHKYEWFVTKMLAAGEQILDVSNSDENWNATIRALLELHKQYLTSH